MNTRPHEYSAIEVRGGFLLRRGFTSVYRSMSWIYIMLVMTAVLVSPIVALVGFSELRSWMKERDS